MPELIREEPAVIFHEGKDPPVWVRGGGHVADLRAGGEQNLYHGLFYSIAKLLPYRLAGFSPTQAYVPWQDIDHQRASLKQLGISLSTIIDAHKVPPPEQLLTCDYPERYTRAPGWALDFIRTELHPLGEKEAGPRRLYLSRADASKRRVLNEDTLLHALAPSGFEAILPAEVSFAKQVALFRDADVIVAPHGAALAGLVFAKPGTVLIELFAEGERFDHYERICHRYGIRHRALFGRARRTQLSKKGDFNIEVNPIAVAQAVEATNNG